MFEIEHIQTPLITVIVPHSFFRVRLRNQPHLVILIKRFGRRAAEYGIYGTRITTIALMFCHPD